MAQISLVAFVLLQTKGILLVLSNYRGILQEPSCAKGMAELGEMPPCWGSVAACGDVTATCAPDCVVFLMNGAVLCNIFTAKHTIGDAGEREARKNGRRSAEIVRPGVRESEH